MVKLVIISDDFTGALDTGVQFAGKNIKTKVITDLSKEVLAENERYSVLVVSADTGCRSGREAYSKVRRIAESAADGGVPYLFKKTDSALRGNIGSELEAVLDAAGEKVLTFVPAFPKMGRFTKEGVQYLGDKPVHLTEFGKDPYEPVRQSRVRDIVKEQYAGAVIEKGRKAPLFLSHDAGEKTIVIYDAATDEDMEEIAEQLAGQETAAMAGCAGLADALSKVLRLEKRQRVAADPRPPLLVICGSVFPVTKRQLAYGESHGFIRISLGRRDRIIPDFVRTKRGKEFLAQAWQQLQSGRPVLIDTMDQEEDGEIAPSPEEKQALRKVIADNLGCVARSLLRRGTNRTLMVIGGDTLKTVMEKLDCSGVEPVAEVFDGTVLFYLDTEFGELPVLSKSGGFGHEALLTDLEKMLEEQGGKAQYGS